MGDEVLKTESQFLQKHHVCFDVELRSFLLSFKTYIIMTDAKIRVPRVTK